MVNFAPMNLTFELELHRVQMNQYTKYLGQRSFNSKFFSGHTTHRCTHRTHCSTWTTKQVGKCHMNYIWRINRWWG